MREGSREATKVEDAKGPLARRAFLKMSGAVAVAGVALGAGFLDMNVSRAFAARGARTDGAVDLGEGDIGIMNYAYALEQLEAAFYTIVVGHPYRGMSRYERHVMIDLRDHEVAHREFFRRILGPNRIPNLAVDFSSVDFRDRVSVLTTARTFEDLGVSAYNGAGKLIQNSELLAAAGRIVSVEARHAAIIRDIIAPLTSSFADDDVVNFLGLDRAHSPGYVLNKASPYIATPIDGPPVA